MLDINQVISKFVLLNKNIDTHPHFFLFFMSSNFFIQIIVFELHKAEGTIRFDDKADLGEIQQINNDDDIEPML